MTTVKYSADCDLCGQPVELDGFTIMNGEARLRFCCAGCQSIYRLLHLNKPEQGHTGNNDTININNLDEEN